MPRKCPVAMQPLMHEKLDEFTDQGVIVPVEEPTDWVFLTCLLMEGKWETMSLSGPKGS